MSANLARRALITLAALTVLGGTTATAAVQIAAVQAPHLVVSASADDNTPWD